MGGIGSGLGIRPNRQRNKYFIEEFQYIDAVQLPFKKMQLVPREGVQGKVFGVTVNLFKDKLYIFHLDQTSSFEYSVKFVLTKGFYGNYRYWFQCPSPNCKQRCRKLFLTYCQMVPLFLCRKCLNLAYQSQNCTYLDRVINKKWALIYSIGQNHDDIDISNKPKLLHWSTFHKKLDKINSLKLISTSKIGKKLGLI